MFEFIVIIILIGIIFSQSRKIDQLNSRIFRMQQELHKYKKNSEEQENVSKIIKDLNEENTVSNESVIQESEIKTNNYTNLEEDTFIKEDNKIQVEKDFVNQTKSDNQIASNVAPRISVEKKYKEQEYDYASSRNLSILITGSILIVLAAIVFLTTTWETIPNVLKTIVLFLVTFVFLGASKISKDKYKLEKASKTFFYISMAYLPICLLSVSVFGLFGEYFSISGAGKYIYLALSTFALAILYYIISKRSNDEYLFYGSLLSQIFSVILFTLVFEERFLLICINLLLYNILLILLTKDDLFKKVYNILPILIVVSVALDILGGEFFDNISWYFIFTCLLISVNFLILEMKNTNIAKSLVFNSFLYMFIYGLILKINLDLTKEINQLIVIFFTSIIIIIQKCLFISIKENRNLRLSSRIVPIVFLGLCSLNYIEFTVSWYFIAMNVLLAINFISLERENTNIGYAIAFNICLFIIGYGLVYKDSFNLSVDTCQILIVLFSISVYIIENILFKNFNDNENLEISARILPVISLLFMYANTLIFSYVAIPSFILAILIEILFVFNLMKSKNKIYKYLIYLFSNIILLDINENLLLMPEINKFVPMITTTFIMFYEMYNIDEQDGFISKYILFFQALSLIVISTENKEFAIIIDLLFALFSIYYNRKNKLPEAFDSAALICLLNCILNNSLSEEFEIGIILLLTTGITYFSVIKKEINVYTIISAIYLFLSAYKINSEYVTELLFIIWGFVHAYFYEDESIKDIFKVITSISLLVLYHSIISDADLLQFTLFKLLGVIVEGMYILHIISKYSEEIDLIEYVFWAIIYLYALTNYSDSVDGMMFCALVLAIIFYSYYKKNGATFLSGILAILLNAFMLTREFWFSIPWWIYLLVLGSSLIRFAIKNEANENKKKISVGSVLKGIKDKVERE